VVSHVIAALQRQISCSNLLSVYLFNFQLHLLFVFADTMIMVNIRRSRYSPLAIPLFRLSVKNLLSKLRVRDRATVGVKIGLGLTDCRIRGKLRQFLVSSFFHFFCAHTRVNTERRGLISSLWAGCDAEMAFWGIFLRGNVRRFFWETYGKIPGGGFVRGNSPG